MINLGQRRAALESQMWANFGKIEKSLQCPANPKVLFDQFRGQLHWGGSLHKIRLPFGRGQLGKRVHLDAPPAIGRKYLCIHSGAKWMSLSSCRFSFAPSRSLSLPIMFSSILVLPNSRRASMTNPLDLPAVAIFLGVVCFNRISCFPTRTVLEAPSVRNTILAGTCSVSPRIFAAEAPFGLMRNSASLFSGSFI